MPVAMNFTCEYPYAIFMIWFPRFSRNPEVLPVAVLRDMSQLNDSS